jgi:hypothetical protein
MSNTGPAAPTPAGAFERTCEGCGETFRTDWPRQRYCSPACKRNVQNARHYAKHRETIIKRNLHNQQKGAR